MPILNYHKDDKELPDMNKPQKCDGCGCEQIGNQMYFRYYGNRQIGVICRPCFQQVYGGPAPIAPPNTVCTGQERAGSAEPVLSQPTHSPAQEGEQ